MDTINKNFDARSDVPNWGRRNPAVVALCKCDVAFRASCWDAKTAQQRRFLAKEAKRRIAS